MNTLQKIFYNKKTQKVFYILKLIWNQIDNFVFLITRLIFVLIPLFFMLGGGGFIIGAIILFIFGHEAFTNCVLMILLGGIMNLIGSQWNDAIREHYISCLHNNDDL